MTTVSKQLYEKHVFHSDVTFGALVNGVPYEKMIALAESAGAGASIDLSLGTSFTITVADNTAFTVANPTNGVSGREFTIIILNSVGAAMGAVTFGTNYLPAGAFTVPLDTKRRSIKFVWDGVLGKAVEVARAAADI